MSNDLYRDMTHSEIQEMLLRIVSGFADYANIEQRLDNGKKADVFYQCGPTTVIIEVKTLLRESLIESAWRKYRQHCNYLAIACPPQRVYNDRAAPLTGWTNEQINRIGIWNVSWEEIREVRPCCRLDVLTPGRVVHMAPASSPFAVIGSPACTAPKP